MSDKLIINEQEWHKTKPKYTDAELLDIFSDNKPLIKRATKYYISTLKQKQQEIAKQSQSYKNQMATDRPTNKIFWELAIKNNNSAFDSIDRQIKAKFWLIQKINGKVNNNGIEQPDIEQAKSVPIQNFLDGKHRGKLTLVVCPFHNEKTASFTIYNNTNTWHCFGCNTGGDVIDFIKKKFSLSFLEAVRYLIQ